MFQERSRHLQSQVIRLTFEYSTEKLKGSRPEKMYCKF